jgi:hypothetical protein
MVRVYLSCSVCEYQIVGRVSYLRKCRSNSVKHNVCLSYGHPNSGVICIDLWQQFQKMGYRIS